MWPLFPCALPNIAVPEEGQQLVLVPTAPKRMSCLLFTRQNLYIIRTWDLGFVFILLSSSKPSFEDIYDELNDSSNRVD